MVAVHTVWSQMMLTYMCIVNTLLLVLGLAMAISWCYASLSRTRLRGATQFPVYDYEYEYLRQIALEKLSLRATAAQYPEQYLYVPKTEYNPPSRASNTTRKIDCTVRRTFSNDDASNKNSCTLKSSHSDSSLTTFFQVDDNAIEYLNESSKCAELKKRAERSECNNRFERNDNENSTYTYNDKFNMWRTVGDNNVFNTRLDGHNSSSTNTHRNSFSDTDTNSHKDNFTKKHTDSHNDSFAKKRTDSHNDSFAKKRTDSHNDSFTEKRTDNPTYCSTGNIETKQTAVVYAGGFVPQTPMLSSTMRMRSNTRNAPPTPIKAAKQSSYAKMLAEQAQSEFQ